jgi:hypothetical protein
VRKRRVKILTGGNGPILVDLGFNDCIVDDIEDYEVVGVVIMNKSK